MSTGRLPTWKCVLAVVAHPDDESFGLGAVLSSFVEHGASVSVLCFTGGEASTLGTGNLTETRSAEFAAAAQALGIGKARLSDHPDGHLSAVAFDALAREAEQFAATVQPDGIVAFDPSGVTGHPDHQRATAVAVEVARRRCIGALGWTLPAHVSRTLADEFGAAVTGHEAEGIDIVLTVDREKQLRAVHCHASQAVPGSLLWRRLQLLGTYENLRWLRGPMA